MNGETSIAALILAGGRSSRMGGQNKANCLLAGKPLLEHVIERLAPQVDEIFINGAVDFHSRSAARLEKIADEIEGFAGPMVGLYSAFRRSNIQKFDLLLVVPCDGPFMPPNLAKKLLGRLVSEDADIAVARYAGHLQPTFSLWRTQLKPVIDKAVEQDQLAGFKEVLSRVNAVIVDWSEQSIDPFLNINSPQDLASAELLLRE